MDNIVQSISVDKIIPTNFHPTEEERRKIEELAKLIKKFSLIDPILVRPNGNKYEIVLGIDKYQAALIANQTQIPAIIKEVDDEIFSKYSSIYNNEISTSNLFTKETYSKKEKKSDIINLSELSKTKLEDEREDLKMNNGQFNNDMNNNFGQPNMGAMNQGPTFGGKFFPSLEDEPTNMNMAGGINVPPTIPSTPVNNTPLNNNLIDLTDLSVEKEPTSIPTPNFSTPIINMTPEMPAPTMDFNQSTVQNFDIPNFGPSPMNQSTPSMEMPNPISSFDTTTMSANENNIINLESLQSSNSAISPMPNPVPNEPVSMDILNADFGAPRPAMGSFDMSNPMNLNNQPLPNFNEPQNPVQPNLEFNQNPMTQPTPTVEVPQPIPSFGVNPIPEVEQSVNSAPTMNNEPIKDVTPVITTIKSLATNLSMFGYKININEEELSNLTKITIEIEK